MYNTIALQLSLRDFGRTYGHFQSPMDMREALLVEDEKEGIRRRIIAEEIDRVRILNAELRREPMMPRVGRLPPSSSGGFLMGFEPRFPPLEQQPQQVQERMVMPSGERLGLGISSAGMPASREFGYVEMVPFKERRVELSSSEVPFEQRSVTPMVSEMPSKNHGVQSRILELKPKPPSNPEQMSKELNISGVGATTEHDKENDKLLAKPNVNLSGVKRREEMAAEAVRSSDLPTNGVPKKKIKNGWGCALCQVSVTSERDLNSHLKGRKHKHKSMEVALTAQGNGKSLRTGGFPEEHKPLNLDATLDVPMAEKKQKTGETASIPEGKDATLLQIEHNADNSRNDKEEAGKGAEKV
ncbi:PREDICTED: uncharacterized protein LOC109173015 isoform X2 [Ipomoea nil]|uniref:uncharacterized protein LOC109173015 isoform X2 n=1 Tax=Ipomoea nil TaxID=35883 RepID=UPI000901A100|nr:PREDICTED: uncharacterized protein LOC109173015 isoform X2 [Ipomoea nil]